MSFTGEYGSGNMYQYLPDAITLIQEAKHNIATALRLLEEQNEVRSRISETRVYAEAGAEALRQTLQSASASLGHALNYASESENAWFSAIATSPHYGHITREQVADIETVLAETEPGAEMDVPSEVQPAPAAEPSAPILNALSLDREALARFTNSIAVGNDIEEPSTAVSALSRTLAPESPDECMICLEVITSLCILQPCEHKFDLDCIMPWLTNVYTETLDEEALKCPLCRQVVDTIRHSIIGDGTATLMIVGPYLRQQFTRHEPRRQWENRMRPAGSVPVYRPSGLLVIPVDGTVTYHPNTGDLVVALYRRLREDLDARRDGIRADFGRQDQIRSPVFERLGQESILHPIQMRERNNAARDNDLEGMGEGASTDLHTIRRRNPTLEGLRQDYSGRTQHITQEIGNGSSTLLAASIARSPVLVPGRGESSRSTPRTMRRLSI